MRQKPGWTGDSPVPTTAFALAEATARPRGRASAQAHISAEASSAKTRARFFQTDELTGRSGGASPTTTTRPKAAHGLSVPRQPSSGCQTSPPRFHMEPRDSSAGALPAHECVENTGFDEVRTLSGCAPTGGVGRTRCSYATSVRAAIRPPHGWELWSAEASGKRSCGTA